MNCHKLRKDDIYIINKHYKFNNITTPTFSQEKIIQKWTFKLQLQTIITTNSPRNETQTAQLQRARLKSNSVWITN